MHSTASATAQLKSIDSGDHGDDGGDEEVDCRGTASGRFSLEASVSDHVRVMLAVLKLLVGIIRIFSKPSTAAPPGSPEGLGLGLDYVEGEGSRFLRQRLFRGAADTIVNFLYIDFINPLVAAKKDMGCQSLFLCALTCLNDILDIASVDIPCLLEQPQIQFITAIVLTLIYPATATRSGVVLNSKVQHEVLRIAIHLLSSFQVVMGKEKIRALFFGDKKQANH